MATPLECDGAAGGGVFPWLNPRVNAPEPQDGAGPDQAGRPVPAVYAVSKPQPLDGVITIGSPKGAAAYAAEGAHMAAASTASTKPITRSGPGLASCLRIVTFVSSSAA